MALKGYGVLAGQVSDSRAEGGADSPHFQIRVRGGDTDFRVAVNVLSQESPPDLLFVADESFSHPLLQALPDLPDGFTAVPSQAGGVALDFIRGTCSTGRPCACCRQPRLARTTTWPTSWRTT